MSAPSVEAATGPRMLSRRRPLLAAVLNILFPGLGLIYAGKPARGVAWLLAILATVVPAAAVVLLVPIAPVNEIMLLAVLLTGPVAGAWLAWTAARQAADPFPTSRWNQASVYFGYVVVVVLTTNLLFDGVIRPHLIQAFRNPSGSNEPMLLIGDYFYVDKLRAREPQRGRLVVFESVEEPDLLVVKRIVALAGDTIAGTGDRLMLNGQPVIEPYAQPHALDSATARDSTTLATMAELKRRLAPLDRTEWSLTSWGPLVVPPSTMFVLGDNRGSSYDSRFYGPVPSSHIRGWPRMIYWSRDSTGIRWRRLGKMIR